MVYAFLFFFTGNFRPFAGCFPVPIQKELC